jgi:hypothetical protein
LKTGQKCLSFSRRSATFSGMGFYVTDTTCERQAKTDPRSKNRVMGSRRSFTTRARFPAPEPVDLHQETRDTSTKTVSGLACWLSRDPIGEREGYSLFLFLRNNPLLFVDALGLDPVGEWISHRYWRDWWWQLALWDDDELGYRDDGAGGTMAERTDLQMDAYYRDLTRAETITCEWKTFTISAGPTGREWVMARHGGFSDAGFWLNQARRVETIGGTYELRRNVTSQRLEIRNTKGEFRWFDRIDNNPSRNDPWYQWIGETLNQVPEWLTGCDFDVQIDWQDDRAQERELQ